MKKKVLSMLLACIMLIGIASINAFANAPTATNLHWGATDSEAKNSAVMIFDGMSGDAVYKITLYKNGEQIDLDVIGDEGEEASIVKKDFHNVSNNIINAGDGSYTYTVGIAPGILDDYEDYNNEDIPVVSTSAMSEAFVYKKPDAKLSAPTNIKYENKILTFTHDGANGDCYYSVGLYASFSDGYEARISQSGRKQLVWDFTDWVSRYNDRLDKICANRKYNKSDAKMIVKITSVPYDINKYQESDAATINLKTNETTEPPAPTTPSASTTTTTQASTPSFENSIPGVNTVNITDIYNNELFEIVDVQEGDQNATHEYKKLLAISEENIHETDYYYRNGLIYKKGSGTSFAGYYDIDGNLLQIGNIIPQSHFDGYCPLSNKLVANGFYDYVNKIAYQLPVNLEMALHMNKIYDVTQTKKINQEASKVYYDYTVNKVYTIKFKKYPIITVKYNNGVINFDQLPIIENGRTLVPLRAIFEKIGADVEWNGDTQTVTATKGDISISLTINNTTAYKNGQPITLDVPAKILNGRTLVPVRFVSDCFGVNVEWDGATQTVILTTK